MVRPAAAAANGTQGPTAVAVALSAVRLLLGITLAVEPHAVPRLLGVPREPAVALDWLARMTGAREIALAGAVLAQVYAGPGPYRASGELSRWLAAAAGCDAADAAALAAAVRAGRVHRFLGAAAAASAAGAALTGALTARALRP